MNSHHIAFAMPPLQPHGPIPPPIYNTHHQQARPAKLRRISRACDFCHRRSIKCAPSDTKDRCKNCVDFDEECKYERPVKKRGIKTGTGGKSASGEQDADLLLELRNGNPNNNSANAPFAMAKWKGMLKDNEAKIQDLVQTYFDIIYPICPFFHEPTTQRRLALQDHHKDQSFFAAIMSICALASARARDGALFPGSWPLGHFDIPPESFYAAAKDAIPRDPVEMRSLEWMRVCAIMALYGIQAGKIETMQVYTGLYHTLLRMDSLHDESRWPKNMGIVETEMRRRLFWSMYTLEIYSSTIWPSMTRMKEVECRVSYPSEIDDNLFSDAGYQLRDSPDLHLNPQTTDAASWLHGWNFTTTLYRHIEHATNDFRTRPAQDPTPRLPHIWALQTTAPESVLQQVAVLYNNLPSAFKESLDTKQGGQAGMEHRYSLQNVNITAVLHLLRMIVFSYKQGATVEDKCVVAREMLNRFREIPGQYLRALSSPLLHLLSGVGRILGAVMDEPLSMSSYETVREVMLDLAQRLESLETGATVGAAARIKNQINTIDSYMFHESHQVTNDTFASGPANISSSEMMDSSSMTAIKHEVPMGSNIDPNLGFVPVTTESMSAGPGMGMTAYAHAPIGPGYGDMNVQTHMGQQPMTVPSSSADQNQVPHNMLAAMSWKVESGPRFESGFHHWLQNQ